MRPEPSPKSGLRRKRLRRSKERRQRPWTRRRRLRRCETGCKRPLLGPHRSPSYCPRRSWRRRCRNPTRRRRRQLLEIGSLGGQSSSCLARTQRSLRQRRRSRSWQLPPPLRKMPPRPRARPSQSPCVARPRCPTLPRTRRPHSPMRSRVRGCPSSGLTRLWSAPCSPIVASWLRKRRLWKWPTCLRASWSGRRHLRPCSRRRRHPPRRPAAATAAPQRGSPPSRCPLHPTRLGISHRRVLRCPRRRSSGALCRAC
mmetsp:Transcript_41559/g.88562  ORF Transcript_41559/g.88562 Transcript_41559/m.88562 type:complete len:256 (-) Transcript_41559:17-784(-)